MSNAVIGQHGLGIGWRPELALAIERRRDLGFIELIAESLDENAPPAAAIACLQRRGVRVVLHGLSLSLGGADRPDPRQLDTLARLARQYSAPIVSEHIAFVRAGDTETGHLLPVPRTRQSLNAIVENIRIAQAALPVPLALENISSFVQWPGAEMDEAEFLSEIIGQTKAWLLLDLQNVYANSLNHGFDPYEMLGRLPLDRVAYVHVAGGTHGDGVFHDTHAHELSDDVLHLLSWFCERTTVSGVMLERDDNFPSDAGIYAELDRIAGAVERGQKVRRVHSNSATSNVLHVH